MGEYIRLVLQWLLMATLFCVLPLVSAQDGPVPIHDYNLKQWTSRDGLSSQSVRTIAQDRMGYIWVGSFFGLNRFDGQKFEVFNAQNTRDLVSNAINKVYLDSTGYLWIGTKSGLSGVDPSSLNFAYYKIKEEVTEIVETPSKEVLVAADGLFRIVGKTISRVKTIQGEVHKLAVSNEGTWVITGKALYLLNDNGLVERTVALPEKIRQSRIRDLMFSPTKGLFLATEAGIYRVNDKEQFEILELPHGKEAGAFKIYEDRFGGLWVSSMGLLHYRYGDGPWENVVSSTLDHRGWFADILEDNENNLWFASTSAGLWRASISEISRHIPNLGFGNNVDSVVVSPDENLWLGLKSGAVRIDRSGQTQLMIPGALLEHRAIYGMAFEQDKVLLATERGLWVYENGEVKVPRALEPIQWSSISVISRRDSGGYWLGTSQGLYQYYDNRLIPFKFNGQFQSKFITVLMEKGNDTWIGTGDGIYRFDGKSMNRISQDGGMISGYIPAVLDVGDLGVLIATLDSGLYFRTSKGDWTHYDESNGLSNGIIVSLFYQEVENRVWVSTMKGVYRFDASELHKNVASVLIENIVSPYDRQLGSNISNCCGGRGNYKAVEFNGSMWYPSKTGVVEIPSDIGVYGDLSQRQPPIVQAVQTTNRKLLLAEGSEVLLGLNDRDFTVYYSTLNFERPHLERFRYRLEGYDDQWHDVDEVRQAGFTNLPSGTFTFTVENRFVNQSWEDGMSTSIKVKIPQQFSETMLYRILVGVLIMLVLYGTMIFIRNRERRKREILKELVDQRTMELQSVNSQLNEANQQLKQLSHKDELSGLRNRHFVFEQLPKDIEHYQRNRESMISQGKSFALILLNIDGFKHINDSNGPIAGDSILTQLAVLLTRETRGSDYVVRWGGDEFLIVLRDSQANQIESFIYELNLAIANGEFYLPDGQHVNITCSIGYALYPLELIGGQLINWEVSLSLADMALHQVKNAGANGWATVEFESHVDAFEFEDNDALETFVEQLFATGAARFNVRFADRS